MSEHERRFREHAELGRLLSACQGYLVLTSDGMHLGVVDHVRYEQHADHPDEIVIRRRSILWRRRRSIPFTAVAAVDPGQRTVTLTIDSMGLEGLSSS
jgi:membrane protein YdbS with pleckstrin-like domain